MVVAGRLAAEQWKFQVCDKKDGFQFFQVERRNLSYWLWFVQVWEQKSDDLGKEKYIINPLVLSLGSF